jgi:alpha-galactosidase
MNRVLILSVILLLITSACLTEKEPVIESGEVTLKFNKKLHTKLAFSEADTALMSGYQSSEQIKVNDEIVSNFQLIDYSIESINDKIGKGKQLTITGESNNSDYDIRKKVVATAYDSIPNLITTKVEYLNAGNSSLSLNGWDNNRYILKSPNQTSEENFWSFQSASYPSRQDWVLPIKEGFEQQNYQGMNATDYGGGTPVLDIWRSDAGLAIGHVETEPQLVSFPVKALNQQEVSLAVSFDAENLSQILQPREIKQGRSITTIETFISAHQGDYYNTLRKYRKIIESKGVEFAEPTETAYEPIWCAWGYERDFTVEKVLNTLPKVKELGFEWAVLDDGWQIAEGDWRTNEKFDEMSMKKFVDEIHDYGLKAKLWWAPLAADPGSRVHENESEMLLVNREGEYQDITWWDSHYLNPALRSTKDYHNQLVKKFMGEWGYDGLKIDGQHLNQVPPAYGNDNQRYPEKSVEELPDLYNEIYNTAKKIYSDAVVEICPCGAAGSSFIMPYMNQPVSSDPLSSWQIRHKGKTYKALMGEDAAYYGDHVELSDNQSDFASTVGIGGVIGSKFTWPEYSDSDNEFLLTKEKEESVKKWMNIYKEYMLPKGEYRGELYDIGFDSPEAHVIEKDDKLFYAFYADSFEGYLELRGLEDDTEYKLMNYETGENIGSVSGSEPTFDTSFTHHLMVVASHK